MVDIYILRHGKAEDRMNTVTSDSKRRLTEVGKTELEDVSKGIKTLGIEFDVVVSSPLIRAKQTAEIALKHVKSKKKSITIWNELKPEIDVKRTIKKLMSMKPNASVLLVGHEPHLSTLISQMITRSDSAEISLKKGGFAHVRGAIQNSEFMGSLRSIMTPKQLKKLCK